MEQEPKTPRERAEDLIRLLISDWRPTPQQVLWTVRIVVALVALYVLIRFGYALQWTGFGQTETCTPEWKTSRPVLPCLADRG
jgi:hypothetical protein